jgi:hypothetical protein
MVRLSLAVNPRSLNMEKASGMPTTVRRTPIASTR